jgi:hypothetical protein
MFTPKRYGLRLTRCCSNAGCVRDYAERVREIEREKEARKQKVDFLKNDKSFQRAKAQKSFNEFIRLRDYELGCISCDKTKGWQGQWHAGHFKTVGARPDLRFNEDNCQKQCSVCNNYLSGNLAQYRENLISRIGIDRVSALDAPPKITKLSASDYGEINEHYKYRIKVIKADKS